jgi:hypothetical protein
MTQLANWETPEQWKKRTGKAWPKNGAVYAKYEELDFKGGLGHVIKKWGDWDLKTLRMARHTQKLCKKSFGVDAWSCRSVIICATEAGPPPDDWMPDEGNSRVEQLANWETPEQWKKRTGKAWPEDWAVYVLVRDKYVREKIYRWKIFPYYATRAFRGSNPIICATEAGMPPSNWKPEEE